MPNALYQACLAGDFGSITALSTNLSEADFTYQDPTTGDTIIHAVVKYSHKSHNFFLAKKIIDKLTEFNSYKAINAHAKPNYSGFTPITLLMQENTLPADEVWHYDINEIAKKILADNFMTATPLATIDNPNPEPYEDVLYWAVKNKQYYFLNYYISHFFCSGSKFADRTALTLAYENKDNRAVAILIRDIYFAHQNIQLYFRQKMQKVAQLPLSNKASSLENIRKRLAHYDGHVLVFPGDSQAPLPISNQIINAAERGNFSNKFVSHLKNLQQLNLNGRMAYFRLGIAGQSLIEHKVRLKKEFTRLALNCVLQFFNEKLSAPHSSFIEEWHHFSEHFLVMEGEGQKLKIMQPFDLRTGMSSFSQEYTSFINSIAQFYTECTEADFANEIAKKEQFISLLKTRLNSSNSAGQSIRPLVLSATVNDNDLCADDDLFADDDKSTNSTAATSFLSWSLFGKTPPGNASSLVDHTTSQVSGVKGWFRF